MPPTGPPKPPRPLPWVLALLALALVIGVLVILLPMSWMLISLVLLFLGVVALVLFHYTMWAYIGDDPPQEPTIPPDHQGKRGPPHRNGSHRPGDPFYSK
jgi:hypothetical protein